MHLSDTLKCIDLHMVLHKRFFGEIVANKPVLLIEVVHPERFGEKILISHYNPMTIGDVLYSRFKVTEYDVYIRKVS